MNSEGIARGAGGGDVKLAVLVGLLSTFSTLSTTMTAVLLAGMIAALVVVAYARTWRVHALPYGPFLIGGGVLALLG